MFAKLKEKIQKEGGAVSQDGLTALPGHASPRKPSLTGKRAHYYTKHTHMLNGIQYVEIFVLSSVNLMFLTGFH